MSSMLYGSLALSKCPLWKVARKPSNFACQPNWPLSLREDSQGPECAPKLIKGIIDVDPLHAEGTCWILHSSSALGAKKALSAGTYVGAPVSMQSRVRGLRQNRLSRQDSKSAAISRRMFGSGRRMRRASRIDSGRRAPPSQRIAASREGNHCAEKVRLPLHERALDGKEDASVRAEPVFRVVGASGRR